MKTRRSSKSGQRTLFGQRGANPRFRPDELPSELVTGSALLVSGYALLEPPQSEAAVAALKHARQAGLFTAMDTAYEPPLVAPEAFKPWLPGLDLIAGDDRVGIGMITGSIDPPGRRENLNRQVTVQ